MNTGALQERSTYLTDQGIKPLRSPLRIQVLECGYSLGNKLKKCVCFTGKAFILLDKEDDIAR